jgi:hypothetical protein
MLTANPRIYKQKKTKKLNTRKDLRQTVIKRKIKSGTKRLFWVFELVVVSRLKLSEASFEYNRHD